MEDKDLCPLLTLICWTILLSGVRSPLGVDSSLRHMWILTAVPETATCSEILIYEAQGKKLQEDGQVQLFVALQANLKAS